MTSSPTAWDDGRLDAAFVARAGSAPPTPPDLVPTVRARVAAVPRRRGSAHRFGRFAPALGLASAVVVVAIIGVGQLGRTKPAASPGPSSPDLRALFAVPMTPSQAIAIRDAGVDDREIAVSGFLGSPSTPRGCPAIATPLNPARLDCPVGEMWLMENQESIETTSGGTTTMHGPRGPAIQPSFGLISLPSLGIGGSIPPAWPFLTLIGHFDDRRASLCQPSFVPDCRDTFVVDRLAAIGNLDQPVTTLFANTSDDEATASEMSLQPVTSESDVDRLVRTAAPDVAIASRQLLTGDRVAAAEPALNSTNDWVGRRLVWIVTAIGVREGTPMARTFLVADGTTEVVEMSAAGPVAVSQSPAPSVGPSQPAAALTSVTDLLAHPITVAEALDRRGRGLGDTEIAVRGWGWVPDAVFDCNLPPAVPPIFAACQNLYSWLAADRQTRSNGGFLAPIGDAFHIVLQPGTSGNVGSGLPADVIALGHFADHRAGLCPLEGSIPRATCSQAFVVDAFVNPIAPVLEVLPFGEPIGQPDGDAHPDLPRGDAIVAAGIEPTSDRLLIAFAMRRSRIDEAEPGVADALAEAGTDVAWIVRFLDDGGGRPVVRTRIVGDRPAGAADGRTWDVTADGLVRFVVPGPSPTPPDDPFAGAPHELHGLVVQTVQMAVDRHYPADDSEHLVRGWYVPHDPAASCPDGPGLDALIRPVLPPCNQGRNWLLDQPEQLWSDPAKVDIDVQPRGATLNPIIPSDVPFEVPPIWQGTTPVPLAVVVLGHFTDPRVQTYAGDRYFVIDQLVWTATTGTVSPVLRRPIPAAETPEAVLTRVEAELGPATTAWLSVLSGTDLAIQDPEAVRAAPELLESPAVWIVRRLIDHQYQDITRHIVATAFVADGSGRIWHRLGCCLELATAIDVAVGAANASPVTASVRDPAGLIADAMPASRVDLGGASWIRQVDPVGTGVVHLADVPGHPGQVAVRWLGGACDVSWDLHVYAQGNDPGRLAVRPEDVDRVTTCRLVGIERTVVLVFRDPTTRAADIDYLSASGG